LVVVILILWTAIYLVDIQTTGARSRWLDIGQVKSHQAFQPSGKSPECKNYPIANQNILLA